MSITQLIWLSRSTIGINGNIDESHGGNIMVVEIANPNPI